MATTKKTTKKAAQPPLVFQNLPDMPEQQDKPVLPPQQPAATPPVEQTKPATQQSAQTGQQSAQTGQQPTQPQVQLSAEGTAKWYEFLEDKLGVYEKQILPDLLHKHGISTQQFKHIVISEVKKNSKLLEAFVLNPSSMFASILAGAEIGLIPSSMLGEFFLIPRKIKGLMTVTPLIGYKGLHSVLMRSGEISRLHTEVVFKGERFEPVYGLEPNIIHIPNFEIKRIAENITHAYAVAKYKNGSYQFSIMSRNEIEAVRKLSSYENTMYFNDKEDPMHWMVKKTVLFQLGKLLPKDYYGKMAMDLEGKLQGGATVVIDETGKELYKIVDGQRKEIGGKGLAALPDLPEQPKQ